MTNCPVFLNDRAARLAERAAVQAAELRIDCIRGNSIHSDRATILDFGVNARGGLAAGLWLARTCLADLADVRLVASDSDLPVPSVQVFTDHPVEACLLSQYAGWKISSDDFFAMGSGPMRVLAAVEPLIQELVPSAADQEASHAVGVLESGILPSESAVNLIHDAVGPQRDLTLLVAPTRSPAGTVQIVARSVETALHRLHELKFPLETLISAGGSSPLPPVSRTDLQGIGRTNDAILYGAEVTLWTDCDDDCITSIGPDVPSCASSSHGRMFEELFAEADHDFYRLDPNLFSPAVIIFHNLKTGRTFEYGRRLPELLQVSFGLSGLD